MTARAVRGLGCEALVVPLFEAVPVAWDVTDARFDAVAMTSANAARLGGERLSSLTHLPLYAVGEATAAAARSAGFHDVTIGAGDAGDLAQLIPDGARLLHLCGTERRALATGSVVEVAVYAMRPRAIDDAGLVALASANVALVHAASAAARLADLVPSDRRATIAIVAVSARAAAPLGPDWRSIAVAKRPRGDAMLALVASLCEMAV